jgi:hypothetical protein
MSNENVSYQYDERKNDMVIKKGAGGCGGNGGAGTR